MKTLVTYYSLSGNTRTVCESVAQALDADIEQIVEIKERVGISGYLSAGFSTIRGRGTPIHSTVNDPSDYDLLVIGTPVWVGSISTPVRTFIRTEAENFPSIAVVCTQGGSGADRAIEKVRELTGTEPVATLVVTQTEVEKHNYQYAVEQFVQDVTESQSKSPVHIDTKASNGDQLAAV